LGQKKRRINEKRKWVQTEKNDLEHVCGRDDLARGEKNIALFSSQKKGDVLSIKISTSFGVVVAAGRKRFAGDSQEKEAKTTKSPNVTLETKGREGKKKDKVTPCALGKEGRTKVKTNKDTRNGGELEDLDLGRDKEEGSTLGKKKINVPGQSRPSMREIIRG